MHLNDTAAPITPRKRGRPRNGDRVDRGEKMVTVWFPRALVDLVERTRGTVGIGTTSEVVTQAVREWCQARLLDHARQLDLAEALAARERDLRQLPLIGDNGAELAAVREAARALSAPPAPPPPPTAAPAPAPAAHPPLRAEAVDPALLRRLRAAARTAASALFDEHTPRGTTPTHEALIDRALAELADLGDLRGHEPVLRAVTAAAAREAQIHAKGAADTHARSRVDAAVQACIDLCASAARTDARAEFPKREHSIPRLRDRAWGHCNKAFDRPGVSMAASQRRDVENEYIVHYSAECDALAAAAPKGKPDARTPAPKRSAPKGKPAAKRKGK